MVVDISYSVRFYKVEPKKIIMQPVNVDALKIQSVTVLYFFILLHILLNTRLEAVNSKRWCLQHHLINASHYTPKKKNCNRILKIVPFLVSKSKAKARKKNRRKIKKSSKNHQKIKKPYTPKTPKQQKIKNKKPNQKNIQSKTKKPLKNTNQ